MKELTKRETEILSLIAKGYSNKTIAVELGIKVRTVKNHCTRIFLKLGVKNRTQAALKVIDKPRHLI
ncbi:response regulator transcription factor [bacterium]|nr:response regulator transcription factor [bacterium]